MNVHIHGFTIFRLCSGDNWLWTIKAKFFRLSHDVVTCDVDRDVSTASLLQVMRSTGHAWSYKHDALLWLVVFQRLWLVHFDPSCFHSVICSLGGPLSHSSPVVVCFDRGHPRFWNFYSTIPVDVVRVKSHTNCLFDSVRVVIRVTNDKLYFVPGWLVSGVVSMLWNGGGLGTGETDRVKEHDRDIRDYIVRQMKNLSFYCFHHDE